MSKRNKVILDTYIGSPTFGVMTAEDSLVRRVIFIEDLKNIIGFRTYQPMIEYEGIKFYEVAHFAELLYFGSVEAHTLLNMKQDMIDNHTPEFLNFRFNAEKMVSQQIVSQLSYTAETKLKQIEDKISYFSDEKSVKKLGYDKEIAYLCNLYLRLAKDLLIKEKFIVDREEDADILTAIKEGRFKKRTLVKEIEEQLKEVKKLYRDTRLPEYPSKDLLNSIILETRNVDKKCLIG